MVEEYYYVVFYGCKYVRIWTDLLARLKDSMHAMFYYNVIYKVRSPYWLHVFCFFKLF